MTLDANDIARIHSIDGLREAFDRAPIDQASAAKANADRANPKSWRDHVMTADELRRRQFPDVSYVIPGLIPEGLSIIAGRPKVGKSWLALDLSIAVADERECLGDRRPGSGDVLYAALEDNPRRLQRRIDKLLSPFSDDWPSKLTLATQWRRLDQGGVDDIREWADEAKYPRFVILDTYARVKPETTNDSYSSDYKSLEALHRLANEHGLAVLVLHHTRKMDAADPLDTVSGTLGLAGCADTVLVIARNSQGTTLYVRGRDVEEAEHAVNFDKPTCRWEILGDAADVRRSDTRNKILRALKEAGEPIGPADIAAASEIKENTVKQRVRGMVRDGEVIKIGHGRYVHPDHNHPSAVTTVTS